MTTDPADRMAEAVHASVSPAVARAALQDVLARMSDTDVVALWTLIASWVVEPPSPGRD